MKIDSLWREQIPSKDSFKNSVHDLVYSPDGAQLLAAVGNRILVYDAADGDLLHSLKGHRDLIYTLTYSRDGKRFASGGADKTIIIWTAKCEGILKYSHGDSIQCLAYNPVTQQLASGTSTDFGLWSPEQKSVQKYKVSAKVCCMGWTNDGQYLALGQINGHISIRDKQGNEKNRIERKEPIWCLQWQPRAHNTLTQLHQQSNEPADILTAGCWDQTLSFYTLDGATYGKDRQLQYDPTSLHYFGPSGNEFMLCGGSDKKCHLYTKEGIFLKTVGESSDWIWSIRARPMMQGANANTVTAPVNSNNALPLTKQHLVTGSNDGQLAVYGLNFSTVHGLYNDRYASRENITDVIIQHLITEQKVRIKTRDYVKKIAIYKSRLAIQLSDRILIYETQSAAPPPAQTTQNNALTDSSQQHHDPHNMNYRLKHKIISKLECNLLVVTTQHFVLCHEKVLELYEIHNVNNATKDVTSSAVRVREWRLESVIRYIRVIGGPDNSEGLLVGLKSGEVYQIYLNNEFALQLITHSTAIRCLDLSPQRNKLAVVDERSEVWIYDLPSKQVLFHDLHANSVAWNLEMNEMFCFTGNNTLSIQTSNFPITRQALNGFVVGFHGSKIFCLNTLQIQTIDIPQSQSMYRYLQQQQYSAAYDIACLGVTTVDWKILAMQALLHLELTIARKAFIHLREVRYIHLINRMESTRTTDKSADNDTLFLAEIHAFEGQYDEACKLYLRINQPRRAIQMYLQLRQYMKARELLAMYPQAENTELGITQSQLLKKQAEWLATINDPKASIEMYWTAEAYNQAIDILNEQQWYDELYERCRLLNGTKEQAVIRKSIQCLQRAAAQENNHFATSNITPQQRQQYQRYVEALLLQIHDIQQIVETYIQAQRWNEIYTLSLQHPDVLKQVYEPYADWLALHDRWISASHAYTLAGKPEKCLQLLENLIQNAVIEQRYSDVSYAYHLLAGEVNKHTTNSPAAIDVQHSYYGTLSHIYAIYAHIHTYISTPFHSLQSEMLFNGGVYLLMLLNQLRQTELQWQQLPTTNGMKLLQSTSTSSLTQLPQGLQLTYILYTLVQHAMKLQCYKYVRTLLQRSMTLMLPYREWEMQLELLSLQIRTEAFTDSPQLIPTCYRCSSTNSLQALTTPVSSHAEDTTTRSNCCTNCFHSFQRSMLSYEVLPLVQFEVDSSVSDETIDKILSGEQQTTAKKAANVNGDSMQMNGNAQSLDLDGPSSNSADNDDSTDDSFYQQLMSLDVDLENNSFKPIVIDEHTLQNIPRGELFVVKSQQYDAHSQQLIPKRLYYRSVIPDLAISQCSTCYSFFDADEYEFYLLQHEGQCPHCRTVHRINDFHYDHTDDAAGQSALQPATNGSTAVVDPIEVGLLRTL